MNPELIADIKTLALCAVIAWGFTEVLKPLLKRSGKRRAALRSLALVVGGVSGWFIYPELNGQGGSVVGAALGTAAGALDAVIVFIVKSKIESAADDKT